MDVVIVGGGHNGLVAAFYLARAGVRVTLLERRGVVGGACVTEEFHPGFKVSTAAYSLSLLRPDVFEDMRLAERKVVLHPKDPQLFAPLPDGRSLLIWRDEDRSKEEIARISEKDADAYPRWNAFWEEATSVLRPFVEASEPPSLSDLEALLGRSGKEEIFELAVAGSVAETTEIFFESDEMRGIFASQGIIGTASSPFAPGTAWVFTYHYLGGEICGATGSWAYVFGGMGSVTSAMAEAARDAGAEIRTEAAVVSIVQEGGRVRGVELADGSLIEAPVVMSNADPVRTASLISSGFPPDYQSRVEGWRFDGCVVKVNLALKELPEFTALPSTNGTPGPQHLGTITISPSLEYLDAAHRDSQQGEFSRTPFMEAFLQSSVDPSLAPQGQHVMSAFSQYAPNAKGIEDWSRVIADAEARVIDTLNTYAPNLRDAVIASQALGAPELEEKFGLTGGDIFHGAILPEQSFGNRFDYHTPVQGLYLCGSGARPGGGVMGAAGRNAARVVLADLGRAPQPDRSGQ